MNLFSSNPELEAEASALHAQGLTHSEALKLAQERIAQRREHVGSITKVLPASEYGPLQVGQLDTPRAASPDVVYVGHPDQLPPIRGRS